MTDLVRWAADQAVATLRPMCRPVPAAEGSHAPPPVVAPAAKARRSASTVGPTALG
ncbi:hypothetical protein JCM18899A_40470 [Nocardioides sp. AN3]